MVVVVSAEADRHSFWKFYESAASLVFCDLVEEAWAVFDSFESFIRWVTEPPTASRMSVTPAIDPSLRTATVPWHPSTYYRGETRWADSRTALFALLPGTDEF